MRERCEEGRGLGGRKGRGAVGRNVGAGIVWGPQPPQTKRDASLKKLANRIGGLGDPMAPLKIN